MPDRFQRATVDRAEGRDRVGCAVGAGEPLRARNDSFRPGFFRQRTDVRTRRFRGGGHGPWLDLGVESGAAGSGSV